MRVLIEVVRHLDGQAASGRKLAHQRRQQACVIRNPLQYSVGENHIEGACVVPGVDVGDVELHLRQALACGLDHVGRTVQASDRSVGKTLDQQLGGVTGATTDIDGRTHIPGGDGRQQVTGGTGAFIFKSDVLFGGPTHCVLLSVRCPRVATIPRRAPPKVSENYLFTFELEKLRKHYRSLGEGLTIDLDGTVVQEKGQQNLNNC
ncbi:hypothetical protein D9M71_96740 [compost metagenome]